MDGDESAMVIVVVMVVAFVMKVVMVLADILSFKKKLPHPMYKYIY